MPRSIRADSTSQLRLLIFIRKNAYTELAERFILHFFFDVLKSFRMLESFLLRKLIFFFKCRFFFRILNTYFYREWYIFMFNFIIKIFGSSFNGFSSAFGRIPEARNFNFFISLQFLFPVARIGLKSRRH